MTLREGTSLLTEKTPLRTTIGAAVGFVVAMISLIYYVWQARESELTHVRAETKEMITRAVEPMLRKDDFYKALGELETRLRDKIDQRNR